MDLSKQQGLNADPKTIQKINSTGNIDRAGNTCFPSLKKRKKIFLMFDQEL